MGCGNDELRSGRYGKVMRNAAAEDDRKEGGVVSGCNLRRRNRSVSESKGTASAGLTAATAGVSSL